MPAVFLPSTVGSEFADLQARVRKLETYRASPPQLAPNSLVRLATSSPAQQNLGYSAAAANLQWLAFVPTGPTVLGIVSDTFFANPTGTANYLTISVAIMDSTKTTVLFQGGSAYQTVNGTSGVANAGLHVTGTGLTPGTTYYLVIRYLMQGGATTGITDLRAQLDVYQMGSATVAIP